MGTEHGENQSEKITSEGEGKFRKWWKMGVKKGSLASEMKQLLFRAITSHTSLSFVTIASRDNAPFFHRSYHFRIVEYYLSCRLKSQLWLVSNNTHLRSTLRFHTPLLIFVHPYFRLARPAPRHPVTKLFAHFKGCARLNLVGAYLTRRYLAFSFQDSVGIRQSREKDSTWV